MRNLIILAILVVAGYFGWQHFIAEPPAGAGETNAEGTEGAGAEGGEAFPLEGTGTPVSGDAGAAGEAGSDDPGTLPPALAEQLAAAEQQWRQLKEQGLDPAACEHSIDLARSFSEVLRATYGKPKLTGLGDRLVADYLDELGSRILLSRQRYPKDDSGLLDEYVVQSGDILDNIGRKFGLSYHYLNMLRGRVDVEDGALSPGERLKIVHAKDKGYFLHVDKSEFHMDVHIAGLFARRYPIAIGEEGYETPAGETFIEAREREPTWNHPQTNETIPYGHPDHIIGPVWLRLNPQIGKAGLGIHGYTGDGPATGMKASNGCIRMRNEDAKEVYNLMVPCMYDSQGAFITRAPMKVVISP